jgi:DNA replication protein DnaC
MSPKDTTPTDRLQQIRDALDELRLADMKTQLERELAQGDSHWLDRVGRLLEAQRRARRERAIERRIDEARFPAPKSLDNFDFDFQTGVDRDQILHLATLDWLARRESLLVAGMSGTGKSHIAIALGHLACVEGYRVRYTTSADMLTVLHLALATQDLQQATKPFVRCELLIIDEVGLDKPERQAYKTHDASLFYKVVAARYQAGRSCLIYVTWNQLPGGVDLLIREGAWPVKRSRSGGTASHACKAQRRARSGSRSSTCWGSRPTRWRPTGAGSRTS